MLTEMTCPGCGATVHADTQRTGSNVVCPKCRTVLEIAQGMAASPVAGADPDSVNPFQAPAGYDAGYDAAMGAGAAGLTAGSIQALASTRPWVLFLATLILIGGVLMLIVGGFMLVSVVFMVGFIGFPPVLVLLISSLINLAAGYYLLAYGRKIGRFLRTLSPYDLEAAFVAQKSFWNLVGLLTVVFLGLYRLILALSTVFMLG